MDLLNDLTGFFMDTTFSVPLAQMVIFVGLVSVCMLLGRYRFGLVVTLAFVFFWSFVLNFRYFVDLLNTVRWGLQLYALSGLLLFAMILMGLFLQRSE
jgi:hypothetical protein